jgi:hypothetical protein
MRIATASPVPLEWPSRRSSKCRLCSMAIKAEDGDDVHNGLCSGCKATPEAADLLASPVRTNNAIAAVPTTESARASIGADGGAGARAFNAGDLGLIRRVGAHLPLPQLLAILNERLVADLGAHVPRYSLPQLREAIARVHGEAAAGSGLDWPSLRRLLARARRAGVLEAIDEQVINDFAVTFQLTTKQTLELKDIVLPAAQEN